MIQTILIVLIFLSALGYLGYLVGVQFFSKKSGCAKGCSCNTIDLDKIEKALHKKG